MTQPQTATAETSLRETSLGDSGGNAEQAAAAVINRWYAAWNAHDPSALAACLTADVVLEEPTGTYRGPDPILEWARSVFRASTDFELNMLEAWTTPGGAVIATYWKATFTFTGPYEPLGLAPTNGQIKLEGMDRNEIRDGRIARHQIFYDGADLAHQMGAEAVE